MRVLKYIINPSLDQIREWNDNPPNMLGYPTNAIVFFTNNESERHIAGKLLENGAELLGYNDIDLTPQWINHLADSSWIDDYIDKPKLRDDKPNPIDWDDILQTIMDTIKSPFYFIKIAQDYEDQLKALSALTDNPLNTMKAIKLSNLQLAILYDALGQYTEDGYFEDDSLDAQETKLIEMIENEIHKRTKLPSKRESIDHFTKTHDLVLRDINDGGKRIYR